MTPLTSAKLRRLRRPDSAAIHADLTTRQYLRPHLPLTDALTEVAAALGLTLTSMRRALDQTSADPSRAIGRLTRAELENLARQIHQAWRKEQ